MPDVEKPKGEDKASQTNVSSHVQTISLDKISKNSEQQGITINVYPSSYLSKSDKPVQTELSATKIVAVPVPENSKELKNKTLSNLASESKELRSFDYSPTTFKQSTAFLPYETKQKGLMNARKFSENKATGRTATDLERKKLEAELKATEEIAKLQQTVIEKRLALELASLQDHDYLQKSLSAHQSLPYADLRAIAEKDVRKESSTEVAKATDKQNRTQPPRPPPPTRTTASDAAKFCNKKIDPGFLTQTSSDFTPLRNLIEKKINLERRSSKTSDSKHSTQNSSANSSTHERRFFFYPDSRFGKTSHKSTATYRQSRVSDQPGSSRSRKANLLWKSAVSKIKKMKSSSKSTSHK